MKVLARSAWGTAPPSVRLFPVFMLLLVGFSIAIVSRLELFPGRELLAAAVSIDLTITLSLAWFLMVARPLRLPLASTLLFFIATVVLAELLLPVAGQGLLGWISMLAVPVELFLVWKAVTGVRGFLSVLSRRSGTGQADPDMLEVLQESMQQVAGRNLVSEILASEMAIFHYAFSRAREGQSTEGGGRSFTYHRNCDYLGLVLAISILVTLEMLALHLLVHHYWGAVPAWVLTGLSAYGFLWLRADSVASTRRMVEAGLDGLDLRCGLRWTARIQWQQVGGVELLDAGRAIPRGCLRMVLTGEPNCLLRLREPVMVAGTYGMKRSAGAICLAIDDVTAFQGVIEGNVGGNGAA